MHALNDIPFFAEGWYVAVLRLVAAFAAGAILGLDREHRERPAGLRTHVLVSLTACLSMLATLAVGGDPSNPGRVAQGVLTGIGFLGAGTIMRQGNVVRGLTTAASVWAAAVLGMALGAGWYLGAVVTLGLAVVTLTVLRIVERPLRHWAGLVHIQATLAPGAVFPQTLTPLLAENDVEIHDLDVAPGPPAALHLVLEPTAHLSPAAVLALVRSAPGVAEAQIAPPGKRL